MSGFKLTSDTLDVVPGAGSIEYNGQFFGTDSNSSRAQMGRLVHETAKASTSGTVVDFTGIPAWAKRITLMLHGVSTNGVSGVHIQIGSGTTPETSGYVGSSTRMAATIATTAYEGSGFAINPVNVAASLLTGVITIVKMDGNKWACHGIVAGTATNLQHTTAGIKSLSGVLDMVRVTSLTPDTFDAGSINILYEG